MGAQYGLLFRLRRIWSTGPIRWSQRHYLPGLLHLWRFRIGDALPQGDEMTFAARLAAGSPIATPTWSQFKAVPYGPQVAAVAAALGHPEIPPEGRSSTFQSPNLIITRGAIWPVTVAIRITRAVRRGVQRG